MRILIAVLMVSVGLAGCADDAPIDAGPPGFPLDVYRFAYEGSDAFVAGVEHGWMVRLHNPSDMAQDVSVLPTGIASGVIGPISSTSGAAPQIAWLPGRVEENQFGSPLRLEPGDSALYLARVTEYTPSDDDANVAAVSLRVLSRNADDESAAVARETLAWNVDLLEAGTLVVAGDHVQTTTVGVWLNGTSFYSNAAGALQDPDFPHGPGWTTADDDTATLPIYVYDQSAEEQPAGSQDTCNFPTITGYNGLLKTQAEGSTNVALLRPDAAYTAEGREDHPLYGDFLVFMNTVVAHDGATGPEDEVPNPTGACFGDRVDAVIAAVEDLPPV